MRRGRGTMTSMLQQRDIGTLILNNAFDLQFGSHQSRSHRKCFLVTLADSSLGHSQKSFCCFNFPKV